MPDLENDDPALALEDLVHDPVVALAEPVRRLAAGELLRSLRSRLGSEGADAGDDAQALGARLDSLELARRGALDLDAIGGHAA